MDGVTRPTSYPAPAALVEHCRRAAATRTSSAGVGSYDLSDITRLVQWLAQQDTFADYDSWVSIGMSLRVEAGDAGLDIWRLAHDSTVTEDVETSKWNSFATEPGPSCVTLGTWMQRARQMGWTGQIRKSTQSMFGNVADTVAQLAQAAGASLSSAGQAMPLLDTQRTVAALGQPILDNFLAGTTDAPLSPRASDYPTLPESNSDHPLYEQMRTAVERIMAMAEEGSKGFRQTRVLPTLAVLNAMHPTVCEHLCQRIIACGGVISAGSLDSAIKNFEWRVRVEHNTAAGFILDSKGNPAAENSDNVHVFIRQRGIKLRWNTWHDYAEVSDADKDAFLQLSDHVFGDLLMDAENSHFNYHPSEGRFRRGLVSSARRVMYDPLLDRLDSLADKWDRVPRLDNWMSYACGVPADAYHVAVGRNLIGGMVRRARHPGCVQTETVIFISPEQGTGKSTLTKILALDDEWHTDSFKFGGSQQNSIPQLAGKWVIELSELAGMKKTEVEDIKNFMSATSDNYTKKYEAFATTHPRRCVFIGTSNDRRPLADSTGNRRFNPVHINGEVNLDWLRANVEQIIGEAAAREAAGESFAIPKEVYAETKRHQEAARSMTPVEELCYEWFDRPPGSYYITASDITRALKMAGHFARYSGFMDKMGWRAENLVIPTDGRKCRVWVRHPNNKLQECVRLAPAQPQVNGPIEMRMVPGTVGAGGSVPNSAVGLPPLPPSAPPIG
jgi:predicted P-loop ATPase